jgi:hypothetical protein
MSCKDCECENCVKAKLHDITVDRDHWKSQARLCTQVIEDLIARDTGKDTSKNSPNIETIIPPGVKAPTK